MLGRSLLRLVLTLVPLVAVAQDPTSAEGGERTGGWRLADSSSVYLREHAENPVEWYPWGDEAFARARELDRPVFLSIGYSSCHWCHVMRRESFSDPRIARYLNEHYICIKVDREDLPHVDSVYMDAVRLMTGRGGWPLSVFLTHDRVPFFGGTYFPPAAVGGRPGFIELIEQLDTVWRDQREKVIEQGQHLLTLLRTNDARVGDAIGASAYLALGLEQVRGRFDSRFGGWRAAPKFPDPRLIDVLIASSRLGGPPSDAEMAVFTLEQMRAGGIYDQIRGGFHRYAVDGEWAVPHFEKMLYSQGLLGESYAEAYRLTGNDALAETVRGVLDALLLDFRLESGAFAASFDADSGGQEGTYYVWAPAEVNELLGEQEGALIQSLLGITAEGNFEGETTVLSRRLSLEEAAQKHSMGQEQAARIIAAAFEKMVARRSGRVAPKRDDKVVLGWNATAISALARGAVVLRDHRYRIAAEEALAFLRENLVRPEGFLRGVSSGAAKNPATLADAALYLKAVLDLYEANLDSELIGHAREVATWIAREFGPGAAGGAFFEAPAGVALPLERRKQPFGSAIPSGNGTHARNLLRLHALTAEAAYRATADAILTEALASTGHAPSAAPELMIAALMREVPIPEIAVSGDLRHPTTRALLEPALRGSIPYRVVAHRPPGEPGEAAARRIPILAERAPIDGRPTAWLCVDFVCQAPTQEPAAFTASLEALRAEAAAKRSAGAPVVEEKEPEAGAEGLGPPPPGGG